MNRNEPRPAVIVLEGIDGTGKTTVGTRLAAHFNTPLGLQHPFHHTAVGRAAYPLMQRADARTRVWLAAAAHCELWQTVVYPAYERGETVIVDRGMLSFMVYEGQDEECFHRVLGANGVHGLGGVVHLILDAPLSVVQDRLNERADSDAFDMDHASRAKELRGAYRQIYKEDRTYSPTYIYMIAAQGTVDAVVERCLDAISGWQMERGAI